MSIDEPTHRSDRAGGRRRRRGGRPREEPRPGDLHPQPQDRWGELYCVYKLYDRTGTLLYVGETDDVVGQLTEHQRGTRLQWGGRLDDRSRWWADVVHITVEHLPPGTTEWEAKAYARSQLALGPLYNTEVANGAERAKEARVEAEQRDAEQHDRARQLHARHDGVTRSVRPNLSIVPRFPGSHPAPATAPTPAPAAGPTAGEVDDRVPSIEDLLPSAPPRPGPPPTPEPVPAPRSGRRPDRGATLAEMPRGGGVATATRPEPATAPAPPPTAPAPSDEAAVDHSLDHQGRYLLLMMLGVFLGIVLLSIFEMVG